MISKQHLPILAAFLLVVSSLLLCVFAMVVDWCRVRGVQETTPTPSPSLKTDVWGVDSFVATGVWRTCAGSNLGVSNDLCYSLATRYMCLPCYTSKTDTLLRLAQVGSALTLAGSLAAAAVVLFLSIVKTSTKRVQQIMWISAVVASLIAVVGWVILIGVYPSVSAQMTKRWFSKNAGPHAENENERGPADFIHYTIPSKLSYGYWGTVGAGVTLLAGAALTVYLWREKRKL